MRRTHPEASLAGRPTATATATATRPGRAVARAGAGEGWVRACAVEALPEGSVRGVPGLPIVVGRNGAGIFAVGGYCPHTGARLEKGRIVGDCVECPVHGALFALAGGRRRRGPARRGIPSFDVQVRDGIVYVSPQPRRRGPAAWLRR
ncbi:MAG: Rieske 2Fe-2S domain-containing protein [Streptosporangiales bacterium]|nr:Rieske 2Fe-2S domain-containing protein [Streptosporangiales bacterium]